MMSHNQQKQATIVDESISQLHEKEFFSINTPLKNRVKFLESLPYTTYPFNKRSWGHNWHGLCSYQSRLKASLAHFLVLTFSKPKDRVLDPFSGVGTVPFESCMNGRIGYGVDINPVAYNTTLAKVTAPRKEAVTSVLKDLEKYLSKYHSEEQVDDYTRRFYHADTLSEILSAKDFFKKKLQKNKDGAVSFLLASMLHILHGNRPYALSRRSHNLTPLAPSGPFIYKSVIDRLTNKINLAYKNNDISKRFEQGESQMGSVFDLPHKDDFFDVILTSPPFWGSTRFYANNRLRLWFCGWDHHTQGKKGRSQFLEECQKQGLSIYENVFSELFRVLKDDGTCVMHLGVTKDMDIGKKIKIYAKNVGFEFTKLVYEDTSKIEHHGMSDQGVTHMHQFLILKKN